MSGTNYLSLRTDAPSNTTSATVGSIGFSTLVGSTLSANTAALASSLSVSSLTTGFLGFSTLVGSSMSTNLITVQSTITASTLTASGNVGIGSAAPVHKLDVNGSASVSGSLYMADGQNLFIGANTSNAIRLHHITNQSYFDYGSADLNIRSNDGSNAITDQIIVKQNGNVGIGNNNPNTKLWIAPGISSTTLEGTSQWGGIHLQPIGTGDSITGITFGGNEAGGGAERQSQAGIICQSSGGYGTKLYFQTSNAYVDGAKNRMVIDHLGNVGIGTANPTTTLHVHATTTATTSGILSSRFYLSGPGDNQDATGANQDGPWYGLGWSGITGLSGSPYVCLAGWSGVALRSGSGFLQLADTGKVGIGITNPAYLLDVNGSARIGGVTNNVVLATNTVQITHPNASFISYNAGYPPDINPIVRNSIAAWYGTRDGVVSRGAAIDFEDVNTNSSYPTAIRGGQIKFYTTSVVNQGVDASLRMTLDVNGNLGIGTATTATSLHIARAVSAEADYSLMTYYENTYLGYHDWAIGPYIDGGAAFAIRSGSNNLPANLVNLFYIDGYGTAIRFPQYSSGGTLTISGGVISASSDRRIKEDIVYQTDTVDGLARVLQLRPATFRMHDQPGTRLGFIAQDVEECIPLAVDGKKYEWKWKPTENGAPTFDADGNIIYETDADGNRIIRPRGLEDRAIIAMQTLAIQQLAKENITLQNHLVSLMTWAKSHGYVPPPS